MNSSRLSSSLSTSDGWSFQVLELQHRISELEGKSALRLEQIHSRPSVSLGDTASFDEMGRQEELKPALADESNLSDGVGGAWVIGRIRHPPLKGRAMRDIGVQAHISPSPNSASPSQGHAQVQTDALGTSDRSSSPLPELPPNKYADDGKLHCSQWTN
jgi:hypothetical protein